MFIRAVIKLVIIAAVCLVWPNRPAVTQHTAQPVDRQRLEKFTRKLTASEFDGRAFKTEGGRKAAEFITGLHRGIGLKPVAGRSDFFQPIDGGGQNIIGMIEGRDAARRTEFVIIAAHYDAFGHQFVGAMDNAAGVAVMLEIARLATIDPPQRSLLFIAFDGGEQQQAGAKFYAEHPVVPLEKTAAMISLSGFGGGMSEQLHDTLYVVGAEFSPQLREAASKHKRAGAYLALAHLALIGRDVMRWPGGEHFLFTLKQTPTITITNGVHYAYHSKADTPNRINFAALEKQVATLAKAITEIANTPGRIERRAEPVYDADEAMEWHRVLTALRENVIKAPQNDAGQAQIDDALLELKRHQNRPVQQSKAREAVILRAANICFYIANPNGVEYDSLLNRARNHEQAGERQQAIAAYQKLLKFIEEEYARDDQTVEEIRGRLAKLNLK